MIQIIKAIIWTRHDSAVRREMTDKAQRDARRAQQAREIEDNQAALRASIAESRRLIDEASEMTQRHRRECEEDERD